MVQAVIRRRRPYTQYSSHGNEQLPNVLNRQFEADQPDRKWVTDVTYLVSPEKRHQNERNSAPLVETVK